MVFLAPWYRVYFVCSDGTARRGLPTSPGRRGSDPDVRPGNSHFPSPSGRGSGGVVVSLVGQGRVVPRSVWLGRQPLGQVLDRDRVAVLDRVVGRVEQLEEDVGDANRLESASKGIRTKVEEILVAFTGVDIDRPHLPQDLGVLRHHPDRVPAQPAFPDFGDELPGCGVVGQTHGSVLVGRVTGGHAPVIEELAVAFPGEGGAAAEVVPELIEGAVILVA